MPKKAPRKSIGQELIEGLKEVLAHKRGGKKLRQRTRKLTAKGIKGGR